MKNVRRSFRYAKVRPAAMPRDIRELIFHASVFHLSASFEDYLLQCLTSWMFSLQRQNKTNKEVPSRLRKLLFLKANEGTLKHFVVSNSEKAVVDRLESNVSGVKWLDDDELVPPYRFYEPAIRDKKFPSPDNIEALLARFGVADLLSQLSRLTRTDVPLKMQSFIDVRNAIAHESPPNLTEEDLEDHFRSVSLWVELIDRVLFSHVVRCSGLTCWQRAAPAPPAGAGA